MVVVPIFSIVTLFPLTEATVGSEIVKVTDKPELAEAVSSNEASLTFLTGSALKVIACVAFLMVNVCVAVAEFQMLLPSWAAVIATVPALSMVNVLPLIEATKGSEVVKLTDKPEFDEAVS